MNDLKTVIHSHSVAGHYPGHVCVSSPSTMLYENRSKNPPVVHMQDCSGSRPQPILGKNVIHTLQNYVLDMCIVQNGDEELFVTTGAGSKVNAYNTATGELEWSMDGKLEGMEEVMSPWGVTTDGRGHLLICDYNNECIQMFSIRDGTYMGAMMIKQGLVKPSCIEWWESLSSFVVNCRNDTNENIFIIVTETL